MKLVLPLVVAVSVIVATGDRVVAAGAENEPRLEAPESRGAVTPPPAQSDDYQSDRPEGWRANIEKLFQTKIAPSLAGAMLLLALSLLFSTINFFAELRRRQRSLKKAFRYLLLWVCVNYVFALLFLVLILPDGMSLASVSRTLLMYCLVATALPELSANVRLQLGRSDDRTLDLYKYKMRMSDFITRRMDRVSALTQSRDRAFLESHYESQPEEFLRRFRIFSQGELSEVEQAHLRERLPDLSTKSASAVLAVVGERPPLMRKVLDHFADDIDRFRESPKARLLTEIQLDPSRDEVQRFVEAGITTARGFLYRTTFDFQRRRLATATGVTEQRLRGLRVSTQDAWRRRRRRRVRATFVSLAGASAVMLLLAWHGSRLFPTYEPDPAVGVGEGLVADVPAATGAQP